MPARLACSSSWRGGRYREACRDFPGYYKPRLAGIEDNLKQEQDFDYYLGGALEIFGTLLQMGQRDAAMEAVTRLLTSGPFAQQYRKEGQTVIATLKKSLQQSVRAMERACPFEGFSLVR